MDRPQGLHGPKIALLIDFDNVILGVEDPGFDIELVVNALRSRGVIVLGRAYGDWYRHSRHRRKLMEHGIELIETPVFGPIIKNSADIHIALDGQEIGMTQPHIDTFCLVSGDSDFLPLIKRLQYLNKNVIVIAGQKFTSELVRRNCNEYISYENLLAESLGATEDVSTIEGAFHLLERTLNTLLERGMESRSSSVKQMMIQLNPAFSERNFACSQFKQFLDKASRAGIVKLGRRDETSGEFTVLLPGDLTEESTTEETTTTPSATDFRSRRRSERRRGGTQTEDKTASPETTASPEDRQIAAATEDTAATGATAATEAAEETTGAEGALGESAADDASADSATAAEPRRGRLSPRAAELAAEPRRGRLSPRAAELAAEGFVDSNSSLGRAPLRRGRLRFSARQGTSSNKSAASKPAASVADPTSAETAPDEAPVEVPTLEIAPEPIEVAEAPEATTEPVVESGLAANLAAEEALPEIAATPGVEILPVESATAEAVPEEATEPAPKKRATRSRTRKTPAKSTAGEKTPEEKAPEEKAAGEKATGEKATAEETKPRRTTRKTSKAKAAAKEKATVTEPTDTEAAVEKAPAAPLTSTAATTETPAATESPVVEKGAEAVETADENSAAEPEAAKKPARRPARRRTHGGRK